MLQYVVVFVVVLAALVSAGWRLMGTSSRVRLVERLLTRVSPRGPLHAWLSRKAQRQRAQLVSGACSACSSNVAHNKKPAR